MEPFWYCRFLKKSRKAIDFLNQVVQGSVDKSGVSAVFALKIG